MRDHLRRQIPDLLVLEAKVARVVRPPADVHDGERKGLVERGEGVAEPPDARARAEGLRDGAAEGEEGVFGGVVVVDYIRKSAWWLRRTGRGSLRADLVI